MECYMSGVRILLALFGYSLHDLLDLFEVATASEDPIGTSDVFFPSYM